MVQPNNARPNSRNLINIETITQSYGDDPVLDQVSLGIGEGDRIGVVGRNGAGKSTLLRILGGIETPDSGRVSVAGGTTIGYLKQFDDLPDDSTVLEAVVGQSASHEWVTNPRVREAMDALLGGHDEAMTGRRIGQLSGGERRRVDLARLLVSDVDVLLLDEPTNHLDVEIVRWLAEHLKNRARLSMIIVTHDRWFLDEVCEQMWEVVDGGVEEYEGGYSAFVLAKAERERQQATEQHKRNNLIRKELAWLRRGPPARTAKPKFRIDAANELIAAEPPARDSVELLSFANARLGKSVIDAQDAQVRVGDADSGRVLIDRFTWSIGPGDRVGILGPNGAGKTSLIKVLLGQMPPSMGKIVTGVTVKPAHLSQQLEELNPTWRVLEAVEHVARRVELGKGRELTASQLCERLGFGNDAQWTPVGDLSGGERRRLQLTRLLMGGPNVLILDEPTNDFDTETLTALEDLLDGFAGTLLVISHDRYFIERVCDTFVAVTGDGTLTDLPRGVDQYLEVIRARQSAVSAPVASSSASTKTDAARDRQRRKDLSRVERQLEKAHAEEASLLADLEAHSTDYEKVATLSESLRGVQARLVTLEEEWLLVSE